MIEGIIAIEEVALVIHEALLPGSQATGWLGCIEDEVVASASVNDSVEPDCRGGNHSGG
jgi:hypothetical protein